MDKNKISYDDFGIAVEKLKDESGNSYDTISLDGNISRSHLYDLVNRRRASFPSMEVMTKLANYFRVDPEYFYEFRLKKFLDYINSNREFLEECELFIRKVKKVKKETSETDNYKSTSRPA